MKRHIALIMLIGVLLGGCMAPIKETPSVVESLPTNPNVEKTLTRIEKVPTPSLPDHPKYAPIRTTPTPALRVPSGSIFDSDNFVGILIQNRPYQVGDMVQLVLEEETSASKQQELKKSNSAELNVEPLTLAAGPLRINSGDVELDHQQDSAFKSNSNSRQNNSLVGTINVFVSDILTNGNLVVAGEKWITLNEGQEFIRVTGEIRARDITPQNTISSTKLGNARIEYSGEGRQQDNQEPSLISKILSILG
ncbi:MAG: flagellar basal body L-ring protein FlgH [Alteromonadaceae bacterium]|nr:flagellar basal body L-ring protein FlgH [Alteromonadaceae bacterium]